ncbi:MAG: hypothetical protein ACO3RV_08850, partial [Luteolibacter sp.]
LSRADRQYLVEGGGMDASIITSGEPGLVEKEARLDSKTFKRLDEPLVFPESSAASFDLFETPHFLIGWAGDVRPQAIAETAERLWHGMAFVHMNFRRDWGDGKMLILLAEDREVHRALGEWLVNHLNSQNQADAANSAKATWERTGSTSIPVPEQIIDSHRVFPSALVFNVKDKGMYRKDLSPFPTHGIAGRLLSKQMGGVSSFGSEGYFAITTGHAYFKEISLAGKSETSLLTVEGSMQDEIGSKRGFEDGTSWARSLRSLVRTGKVNANLEELLKWKPEALNPERLVLIYSLAYYMQSDWQRLAAYARMVRRVESNNQIPPANEIASIFGFDSVEKFNEDWTLFIKEGKFK